MRYSELREARAEHRRVDKRFRWKQTNTCYWCGIEVSYSLVDYNLPHYATRDHLVPLSLGGADLNWNIVVACKRCNNTRGNSMQWIPFHEQVRGRRLPGRFEVRRKPQ